MGLGDFHRHRRLSGVIALVGVLLYVALIPGHVVSQALSGSLASMQAMHAGGTGAGEPICHRMMGGAKDPAAPGNPTAPHKKCPFCTGYASFHAGLAAGAAAAIIAAEPAAPVFASLDAAIVESAVRQPQNRGPPLEL
jgi:Protein of unknown function (DUF2946)